MSDFLGRGKRKVARKVYLMLDVVLMTTVKFLTVILRIVIIMNNHSVEGIFTF